MQIKVRLITRIIIKHVTESGSETLRVTWEQRSLPDVVEIAVEFHHAFEAKASTCMIGCAVLECLKVVLNRGGWDSHLRSTFCQHIGLINTLST